MKSLPRCTGMHLMVVMIVMVGTNGPTPTGKHRVASACSATILLQSGVSISVVRTVA
jgi:hypothetical protein